MADIARRDEQRSVALQGVSSIDETSPTDIWVDPTSHGLIIDATSTYAVLDLRYLMLDCSNDPLTGTLDGANLDFTGIGTLGSVAIPTVFTSMTEPTGFVDKVATLSFVNATRVFTITGAHDIYINGVKTSKTTDSITITDPANPPTATMNWIYYNASGTLSQTTSQPSFALPLIATLYYNTITDKGLFGEERHGLKMDGDTHSLLHYTVGTRYRSGLTGTFDDTTFTITTGVINDEDLSHAIAEQTTCNVLYKDGAAEFKWLEAQTKYYYEDIGSDINYNNGNVLTPVPANSYVAYWIFATNDATTPIVSLMGQRTDTNIANARDNNTYESLELGTLPFQEMKLLYRVILRNDATPYIETLDLRSISNLPAGTYIASDHGVLSGLADDDHAQYLLADGTRAVGGSLISDTDSTDNLGSSSIYWANAYTDKIYLNATASLDGATGGRITIVGTLYLPSSDTDVVKIYAGTSKQFHIHLNKANFGMGSYVLNSGSLSGTNNVGLGSYALYANSTGVGNTGVGQGAVQNNTTGQGNTGVGQGAISKAGLGSWNTGIGRLAGQANTGSNNTFIGAQNAFNNDGSDNIIIGFKAGYYETGSSTLMIDNAQRTSEADARLKALIYGVFAATTAAQYFTINGNLTVLETTTVKDKIIFTQTDGNEYIDSLNDGYMDYYATTGHRFNNWVRHTSASYRRYYHLDLASFDPGTSGAVWTEADANGVGGWQLDNASETLQTKVDVHADWDGASDLTIECRFQINTASTQNDTVEITAIFYYMGISGSSTKTQTITGSTNVGDGGIKAQYTMFTQSIVLPYDTGGQEVSAGDCIAVQLYLNTGASEVDNIILNAVTYHYNTTHLGIESGDT